MHYIGGEWFHDRCPRRAILSPGGKYLVDPDANTNVYLYLSRDWYSTIDDSFERKKMLQEAKRNGSQVISTQKNSSVAVSISGEQMITVSYGPRKYRAA